MTETTTDIVYILLFKVWVNKEKPKEWREDHLVKLPKKQAVTFCLTSHHTLHIVLDQNGTRHDIHTMKRPVDRIDRETL